MPEAPQTKGASKQAEISRREALTSRGEAIDMPPLDGGGHLIGYLWEFGPTTPAGMGNAPVTFLEMEAWQRQVGIELQPWEVKILRRLSLDYLSASYAATKRDCPPPYDQSHAAQMLRAIEVQQKLDLFLS